MSLHLLLSKALAAFALISLAQCSPSSDTTTVTRLHVTCPCDGTDSTTLLSLGSSWGGWSPTFTNVDDKTTTPTGSHHPTGTWSAPSSQCYTSLCLTSQSGSTTTSYAYSTLSSCTVTNTTTSTVVTTPATPTVTVTASTTTTVIAPATTNTATSTTTSTVTATTTATDTETNTATTSTTSTTTTTIAASATFSPIVDTIPGALGQPGSTKHKRNVTVADAGQTKKDNHSPMIAGVRADDMFPADVTCRASTSICATVTTTVTTTSTASTPSATTATTTTTITVSTTPGVSTTVTVGTTITTTMTTTTTTTTSTTTTSTATATATYYAACDASLNQAYYYGAVGNGMQSASSNNAAGFAKSNPATPYDCCVAAITNPNGAAWAYSLQSDHTCYVFLAPSCANNQLSTSITAMYAVGQSTVQVLGNAYCGEYTAAAAQT